MSEIIKVRINADGVTATEVNKVKRPVQNDHPSEFQLFQLEEWQEAESKLRTFEIKDCRKPCWGEPVNKCGCGVINSIHSAEILDNDKLTIRIL